MIANPAPPEILGDVWMPETTPGSESAPRPGLMSPLALNSTVDELLHQPRFGTSDWQPASLPDPHAIVPVRLPTSSYAERMKLERVAQAISGLGFEAAFNLPTGRLLTESAMARELWLMFLLENGETPLYRTIRVFTDPYDRFLHFLGYTGESIQANPIYVLRYTLPRRIASLGTRLARPIFGRQPRPDRNMVLQAAHVKEVGDAFCLAARLYLIAGNDERAAWNYARAFDATVGHLLPLASESVLTDEAGGLPDEFRRHYVADLRLAARANRRQAERVSGSRDLARTAIRAAIDLYGKWHVQDTIGREVPYAESASSDGGMIFLTLRDRREQRLEAGLWRRYAELKRDSDPQEAAYNLRSSAWAYEAADEPERFHATNREAIELLAEVLASGGYPLSADEITRWLDDEDLAWASEIAARIGVEPQMPRLARAEGTAGDEMADFAA